MSNLLLQISAQNGGARISPMQIGNGVLGLIQNPHTEMPILSKNLLEFAKLTRDEHLLSVLDSALNNGGIQANADSIYLALMQLHPKLLKDITTKNLSIKKQKRFADGDSVVKHARFVIGEIKNMGEDRFDELSCQQRFDTVLHALTIFDGHAVEAAKYLDIPFSRVSRFFYNTKKNPQLAGLVTKWHRIIYKVFEDNRFNRRKTAKSLGVQLQYIEKLIRKAKEDPTSPLHDLRTSRLTIQEYRAALSRHFGVREEAAKELGVDAKAFRKTVSKIPELNNLKTMKGTSSIATFSNFAIKETWLATHGNMDDMAILLGMQSRSIWYRLTTGAERNCPFVTPLKIEISKRNRSIKRTSILDKINPETYHYSDFELRDDSRISDGRLAILLSTTDNLFETLSKLNLPLDIIFKQIKSADEKSPLHELKHLTYNSTNGIRKRTYTELEHMIAYVMHNNSDIKIADISLLLDMSYDRVKDKTSHPQTSELANIAGVNVTVGQTHKPITLKALIKHHGNRDLVANELNLTRAFVDHSIDESIGTEKYADFEYFIAGYWHYVSYDFGKPRKFFTVSDNELTSILKRKGTIERTAKHIGISQNEIEMQIKTANDKSPITKYFHTVRRGKFTYSDKTVAVNIKSRGGIKQAADFLKISVQEIIEQIDTAISSSPLSKHK